MVEKSPNNIYFLHFLLIFSFNLLQASYSSFSSLFFLSTTCCSLPFLLLIASLSLTFLSFTFFSFFPLSSSLPYFSLFSPLFSFFYLSSPLLPCFLYLPPSVSFFPFLLCLLSYHLYPVTDFLSPLHQPFPLLSSSLPYLHDLLFSLPYLSPFLSTYPYLLYFLCVLFSLKIKRSQSNRNADERKPDSSDAQPVMFMSRVPELR